MRNEFKIIGISPFFILTALGAFLTLLAISGGELLNLSSIGFEVIFPFFAAIAVGEWGKTRADSNYDVISSQSKSLFKWVAIRFLVVFTTVSIFAMMTMIVVFAVRNEMPLWEMVCIYFPTAFFLATLSAIFNVLCKQEHISTLICGVVWLLTMLVRSLLRFPFVAYFYLFVRYAGIQDSTWLINKAVLLAISLFLWGVIYMICKRKH